MSGHTLHLPCIAQCLTMGTLNYDIVGKGEFVTYPLDATFYNLGEQEIAFFKSHTGINDEEELKQHILRVQKEAYEVGLFSRPTLEPLTPGRYTRTLPSVGLCSRGETYSTCIYTVTYLAHIYSAITRRLQISHHPIYQDFLRLGRQRPGAIFLEMATCGKCPPVSSYKSSSKTDQSQLVPM